MTQEAQKQEPVAWFRYQQGSRVYYDTKKWDDCQPLYTQSDYERGFIDGMQKQMQSSVDKAVNTMSQRTWQGLTDEDKKQMAKEANYHWEMTAGEYAERIGQLTEAKLKEKNSA
jgi:TRAP-type C4-dicarboxylate transport system substrate-binding protein